MVKILQLTFTAAAFAIMAVLLYAVYNSTHTNTLQSKAFVQDECITAITNADAAYNKAYQIIRTCQKNNNCKSYDAQLSVAQKNAERLLKDMNSCISRNHQISGTTSISLNNNTQPDVQVRYTLAQKNGAVVKVFGNSSKKLTLNCANLTYYPFQENLVSYIHIETLKNTGEYQYRESIALKSVNGTCIADKTSVSVANPNSENTGNTASIYPVASPTCPKDIVSSCGQGGVMLCSFNPAKNSTGVTSCKITCTKCVDLSNPIIDSSK